MLTVSERRNDRCTLIRAKRFNRSYLYERIRPRLERCGLERTPLAKAEVHAAISPNSAGTNRAYDGFLISLSAGR
jgi:hypothetical protein